MLKTTDRKAKKKQREERQQKRKAGDRVLGSRAALRAAGRLGMNIAGNFLLAVSVCAFIVPFDITVGGATGVGVIFQKWLGAPTAVTILIVNMICLPLAWIFVGRRLVVGSLISSFVYPLAFALVEKIPHIGEITNSLMLATIFAGVIGGTGVGLVMKSGGSTGGLDIPPLIFNKKLRWPVKTSMYIMDAAIMLAQLPFIETDRVLYGIVSAYIFTLMIDRVLIFGDKRYEVTVITDEYERLRELMLEHDFGLTMFFGETGLQRQPVKEINAMIRSSQLRELRRLIREVDDNAFVRVAQVNAVHGRGFDREKVTLSR